MEVGGWAKRAENSQAAREPSLKAGERGARGLAAASVWTLAPLPTPLRDPAQEVEAVAGDQRGKLTMLGVLKHPEELGLVSRNKRGYQIVGSLPSPL